MSSSILTNLGATTALRTLQNTNKSLLETQNRVSTGMKVASAKDNAATWAISTTMKSDVASLKAVGENLAIASSTVATARSSSEKITEWIKAIKEKVTAAQDGNVDRTVLQSDIDKLVAQIKGVGDAAQFNGVNYLKGEGTVSILSSLDRSGSSVTTSSITFNKQNLVIGDAAPTEVKTVVEGQEAAAAVASVVELDLTLDPTVGNNGQLSLKIGGVANATTIDLGTAATSSLTDTAAAIETALQTDYGAGVTVAVSGSKLVITDANGRGITDVAEATAGAGQFNLNGTTLVAEGSAAQSAVATKVDVSVPSYQTGSGTTYAAGDFSTVKLYGRDGTQIGTDIDVSAAADMTAVATAMQTALQTANGDTTSTVTWDATTGKLSVSNESGAGMQIAFEGEKAGKLAKLATMDVTTANGAAQALTDIEEIQKSAVSAAAEFGSVQKRIDLQKGFTNTLVDALNEGISVLVDADMTEESARLQALQVQQQLGVQALSMANQSPQSILSLFRG